MLVAFCILPNLRIGRLGLMVSKSIAAKFDSKIDYTSIRLSDSIKFAICSYVSFMISLDRPQGS